MFHLIVKIVWFFFCFVFTEILCPILRASSSNKYVLSNQTDKYTIDMNLTAECIFGYELSSGNLVRTCQENGEWSGQEPICTSRYYGKKFKEKFHTI